jgi:hypothetical protein
MRRARLADAKLAAQCEDLAVGGASAAWSAATSSRRPRFSSAS